MLSAFMISTSSVWPAASLFALAIPTASVRINSHYSKRAFLCTSGPEDGKQEPMKEAVNDTAKNHGQPASAPCAQPGGLRAAKLCSLTGLCSRTKVNIVNTNMRCPTCLVDRLSRDPVLTFFPAVSIDNTVQLICTRASSHAAASWSVSGNCWNLASPAASSCCSASTALVPVALRSSPQLAARPSRACVIFLEAAVRGAGAASASVGTSAPASSAAGAATSSIASGGGHPVDELPDALARWGTWFSRHAPASTQM